MREVKVKAQRKEDLFKNENKFYFGTLGEACKNKIISVEDFDIKQTPKKIIIEKFIGADGQEKVNMWYKL